MTTKRMKIYTHIVRDNILAYGSFGEFRGISQICEATAKTNEDWR